MNVIDACVAEIVPRRTPPRSTLTDYFSDRTYWPAWRFWQFVGVPFAAVEAGIAQAALQLGEAVRSSLARVLPTAPESP